MRALVLLFIGGCCGGGNFNTIGLLNIPTGDAPPPAYIPPPPSNTVAVLGDSVRGSDGTYGWKIAMRDPEDALHLTTGRAMHYGCDIDETVETETRGMCNGVPIVVRRDTHSLYRLCAPGTDPTPCANVWLALSR